MSESYPEELGYNREHDWARVVDDVATLGITWYAQDTLGEVVHYEPPATGDKWMVNIIRHRNTDGYQISTWSCLFGGAHRNDLSGTLAFA